MLLLLALAAPVHADIAIEPPAGTRFLTHLLRVEGLDAHKGHVLMAFDGAPGETIEAYKVWSPGGLAEQVLGNGDANRGGRMAAPGLYALSEADFQAWLATTQAEVQRQRESCERGEGCAHISRFVASYPSPAGATACGLAVPLQLQGEASGPDTVVDVVRVQALGPGQCAVTPGARELRLDGKPYTAAGCSTAAATSAMSLLAGLGLLVGLARRRG